MQFFKPGTEAIMNCVQSDSQRSSLSPQRIRKGSKRLVVQRRRGRSASAQWYPPEVQESPRLDPYGRYTGWQNHQRAEVYPEVYPMVVWSYPYQHPDRGCLVDANGMDDLELSCSHVNGGGDASLLADADCPL